MPSGQAAAQQQTRIVIVGGVAGGVSAAARARRLNEHASIVMFKRGHEASFANCGLPYYIGGEIDDRSRLLAADDRQLIGWLDLDVRTRADVTAIDRDTCEVTVHELDTGRKYREPYDYLILSPGAAPIRPDALLEKLGSDHPRVCSLSNLNDADRIKAIIEEGIDAAVVIGAGFIGLELVEQLVNRGVAISLVDLQPQVMPLLDREMAEPLRQELVSRRVDLHLNVGVAALEPAGDKVSVRLHSGRELPAELVLLAIGGRPESELAKEAGLELTPRGTIRVDPHQRTSDPRIYAVGDAVEVAEATFGGETFVPWGGQANRQGRLAADHIAACQGEAAFTGEELGYRGSQATSIIRVFDLVAAMTGISEKALARLNKTRGKDYDVVYAHPRSHADYYPHAKSISIKLIYEKPSGRVLGAAAVGPQGVDKRIDVIATAIQLQATVYDLEQAELCSAPPFGSANDPVNLVGFIAANALRGLTRPLHVEHVAQLQAEATPTIVDVRTTAEFAEGAVPGALHVPLEELRDRIQEIPPDKPAVTYCKTGQRGYLAERILRQHGYQSMNLSGGYNTWRQFYPDQGGAAGQAAPVPLGKTSDPPTPVASVKVADGLGRAQTGQTIVVFSGDLKRVRSALVMANDAAASGQPVTIFFSFEGIGTLLKDPPPGDGKGLLNRVLAWKPSRRYGRSQHKIANQEGLAATEIRQGTHDATATSLPELQQAATYQNVRLVACRTSMEIMGIERDELIDGLDFADAGDYIGDALAARTNLVYSCEDFKVFQNSGF